MGKRIGIVSLGWFFILSASVLTQNSFAMPCRILAQLRLLEDQIKLHHQFSHLGGGYFSRDQFVIALKSNGRFEIYVPYFDVPGESSLLGARPTTVAKLLENGFVPMNGSVIPRVFVPAGLPVKDLPSVPPLIGISKWEVSEATPASEVPASLYRYAFEATEVLSVHSGSHTNDPRLQSSGNSPSDLKVLDGHLRFKVRSDVMIDPFLEINDLTAMTFSELGAPEIQSKDPTAKMLFYVLMLAKRGIDHFYFNNERYTVKFQDFTAEHTKGLEVSVNRDDKKQTLWVSLTELESLSQGFAVPTFNIAGFFRL